MLALALRRIGHRARASPAQIDPSAYEAATREKLPAPRPSVDRTSSGTPTIHVPEDSVTATASTATEAARIGLGRSAAKPSRIRGSSAPASRLGAPRARTPPRTAAERKKEAALRAKNLIGRKARSRAASAQP